MLTATIEKVEKRQGNGTSYWLVHLGGDKKLYCWDAKLARELQPGATYQLELRDGRFPKLLRARPVASSNGALEEAKVQATIQERLEALRLVLAIAQWESVDEALAAADKVLRWLKG